MKIFIFLYYVAYLLTEISAPLPDNSVQIARIIGLVNNIYNDDDPSDAWSGSYGRIYPRSKPEVVLYTAPDDKRREQTLSYRRLGPENIRLTINSILSTKPRVNQNYHVETQRLKKNNENQNRKEEFMLPSQEKIRPDPTQKEILEFVLLKENERFKRMKQEDGKENRLRKKKDKRLKDSRRPKDKDKSNNKKKKHTRQNTDKIKSKKKSLNKNKRIKKKDVIFTIKDELDLRDEKVNGDRNEQSSKNTGKKHKIKNSKKRNRKNKSNKKQKEKNEDEAKAWKIIDRQHESHKIDKLEKEWNKRHKEYDNNYDNNDYENDIGIVDNDSDIDMEEEWNKRHSRNDMGNSEKQNSVEINLV